MSARAQVLMWVGQRASAALLAICVFVHLATMIYAVRGGLTAAEILARLQGHAGWLAFYVVFVLAVAVHVPIGLRAVLGEWLGWRNAARDWVLAGFALLLLAAGLRAAFGLYGAIRGAA
ncbi:MAG: succinate dehydrogenase [Betaproteobacteria bacterium]|nr:succinate dehydrogenase [Betaproteobacteria bacterium]